MMGFVGSVRACLPNHAPPQVSEITERTAVEALRRSRRVSVPSNQETQSSQQVEISYSEFGPGKGSGVPTIVLLHGFDSSLLEFRRLAPLLEDFRVLLVDLHGWGFTEKPRGLDYGPLAKRVVLANLLEQILEPDETVFIGGASLGGAVAIDYASFRPDRAKGLILIDAQVYLEGSPGKQLFWPLDMLGIQVLRSKPLRRLANTQSYFDPEKFATEDAMLVGRLPCHTEGWFESNLNFLKSDGYAVKEAFRKLSKETLLIWGREDKILSVDNVPKFKEDKGELLEAHILDECGHVPHLEKADVSAQLIREYIQRVEKSEAHLTEQRSSVV